VGGTVSDPAGLKGTVEIVELTPAERAIARRTAEARATVPDLELSVDIDMARSVELGSSITALLVRASARALRENPRANGAYRDGHFELYSRVNAGLVVADGVTATVLDADQKTLAELTAEIDALESKVGDLRPAERSGATFALARYAVTRAGALITPPHAVALAAGEVREVGPAHLMTLTLACDHRIVYGAYAARVLARIRELLERAEE
jgi:pyruvate dehydrogenase E2 component (dihydrolipoamide acetyltransferase)